MMADLKPLNIFYEETPDRDRWMPFDRYPRNIVRRILRGKPRFSGTAIWFKNLCAGLDRVGISYRVNNYNYIQQHPEEIACIIGKPHVLDKIRWKNPILFGPAVYSHPCDDPFLMERLAVKRVLVSSEWFKEMWIPHFDNVSVWAAGIDTDKWKPVPAIVKDIDVLLYDKVMWNHDRLEQELIAPIKAVLAARELHIETIRYGFYKENDFRSLLARSKSMLFLCEHETQGFAYLQALACDVPILAWDQEGFWQDPQYYPHKVKFSPVTPVPYWDERCGLKFKDGDDFSETVDRFWGKVASEDFSPREYILEKLTLSECAHRYVEIVKEI